MNNAAVAQIVASDDKLSEWEKRFKYYRRPPDIADIVAWLELFRPEDRSTAEKVLENINLISESEIHVGYHEALAKLPGWDRNQKRRKGRWYFVGFGGQGESGAHMARIFREANHMASDRFNHLFCTARDLPSLNLTALDNVVFIDDISGSGQQVCTLWPIIHELVASDAKCYLILTVATTDAVAKIRELTELMVEAKYILGPEHNVFHTSSDTFDPAEKATLERYCITADPSNPKGYGSCGLLVVLSHKTPNNSLPIIHVNAPHWKGLFPRYLRAA